MYSATKERFEVTRLRVATTGEAEIFFTGERLNQKDLSYFMELLHLQRSQPLGQPIRFKANPLLKSLGLSVGSSQHTELKESLARLAANRTEISVSNQKLFDGPFLEKIERDEKTKVFSVLLNPQIRTLFKLGYTQLDKVQRNGLRKHKLAKALHGMYSTHAKPFPYKVSTIRKLIGSGAEDLFKFRQQLRGALEALQSAKFLLSFEIGSDDDLVKVTRVATSSKQGHPHRKRLT